MQLPNMAPEGSRRRRVSRSVSMVCVLVFAGWAAVSLQQLLGSVTASGPAGATATTGPCEVGVELRAFPADEPSRFVAYNSYLCPTSADGITVRFRLRAFTRTGGASSVLLTGWSPWQNVGGAQADTPAVSASVTWPRDPSWRHPEFQVQTESSYSEDGQGYEQAVPSRRVPLP